MKIEVVREPGAEWDDFVLHRPEATLGHAAGWSRVFADAYRLDPHYIAARSDRGGIRGVLPLVAMRDLKGRRQLVSLPFLDAAGVLAEDASTHDALIAHALRVAEEQGVDDIEVRGLAAEGAAASALDRVDLVLRLESDVESQWKALRAKVRNQTRKAEREGLTTIALEGEAQIDAFYRPFAINMRDLGSPVHARRFFAAVARAFGERVRFVVCGLGDTPVGGLVAIAFGETVSIPWASTLRAERHRCPNNLIYWEGLRWAVERGAAHLDFGRSPRSGGTHRFKKGWGAEERELDWRRLGPDGRARPVGAPGAGRWLEGLSRLWTRLPVGVATTIGPHVRRRLSN